MMMYRARGGEDDTMSIIFYVGLAVLVGLLAFAGYRVYKKIKIERKIARRKPLEEKYPWMPYFEE